MNDVKLLGRLTADPELKLTPSQKSVTSFSLAVDRPAKSKAERVAQCNVVTADFFTIVCWGNLAEFATKFLGKGRQIVVSGRLQNRKWQDKHGQSRISTEVVANNIYFADSKPSGRSDGAPADTSAHYEEYEEDGLPF